MTPKKQILEYVNWLEEIIKESLVWAKEVQKITEPQRLKDFEAGIRHGATQLLSTLKIQGKIK